MKNKKTKILSVVAAIMCMVSVFSFTCEAATRTNYGTYVNNFVKTEDQSYNSTHHINSSKINFTSTQGFAVDSQYLYSAKISGDEQNTIIYRANKNNPSDKRVLRNAATGKYYINNLGHSNDMCVATVNGKPMLYVATANTAASGYTISGLEITDDSYIRTVNYRVMVDGKAKNFAGITIYEENSVYIDFLLKDGRNIYKARAYKSDYNNKRITATYVFTLKRDTVRIKTNDGKINTTEKISEDYYNAQGFDYCPKNDTLYFTLGGKADLSESVVLTYNGIRSNYISPNRKGSINPSNNLTFYIKSNTYKEMFELEGAAVCPSDGRLYFNCNRRTSSSVNHDIISYFEVYRAF